MTDTDIHSCGYYCDRPLCIKAQRDELRNKMFSDQAVKTYSGGKPNYTQPIEQEPAAWGVDEGEGRCISLHDLYFVKGDADHMAELKGTHAKVVALYTALPKKEWVGLTEAERVDILDAELTTQNTEHFALAQAIESKLKEKNGG
jgi:hypothetical protein